MNNRELYRQKRQAQLDKWKAELDKLRASASGHSADAQLEMKKHIRVLEDRLDDGHKKLSELADASEDAWDKVEEDLESAWSSIKSSFSDAAAKFRK